MQEIMVTVNVLNLWQTFLNRIEEQIQEHINNPQKTLELHGALGTIKGFRMCIDIYQKI